MRLQAWLYGKANLDRSREPAGIYLYLSRGVLWLGGMLIKLSQFFFGRWQRAAGSGEKSL